MYFEYQSPVCVHAFIVGRALKIHMNGKDPDPHFEVLLDPKDYWINSVDKTIGNFKTVRLNQYCHVTRISGKMWVEQGWIFYLDYFSPSTFCRPIFSPLFRSFSSFFEINEFFPIHYVPLSVLNLLFTPLIELGEQGEKIDEECRRNWLASWHVT